MNSWRLPLPLFFFFFVFSVLFFWVEGRRSELKGQANMHKVFRFAKKPTRLTFVIIFFTFPEDKVQGQTSLSLFSFFFWMCELFNVSSFQKEEINSNGFRATSVVLAPMLLLPLVKQSTGRRRKRKDNKKPLKHPSALFPPTKLRTRSETCLLAQFKKKKKWNPTRVIFSFLRIRSSTLQHPLASLWASALKKYILLISSGQRHPSVETENQEEGKKTKRRRRTQRGNEEDVVVIDSPAMKEGLRKKKNLVSFYFFFHRFITLDTKPVMAVAGWSGSSSANRWLTLSVVLPCFLATNPNSLAEELKYTYIKLACRCLIFYLFVCLLSQYCKCFCHLNLPDWAASFFIPPGTRQHEIIRIVRKSKRSNYNNF